MNKNKGLKQFTNDDNTKLSFLYKHRNILIEDLEDIKQLILIFKKKYNIIYNKINRIDNNIDSFYGYNTVTRSEENISKLIGNNSWETNNQRFQREEKEMRNFEKLADQERASKKANTPKPITGIPPKPRKVFHRGKVNSGTKSS